MPSEPRPAKASTGLHTSSLPLLVPRVLADDDHHATTADNLALIAHTADAGANLHEQARGDGQPRLRLKWDVGGVLDYRITGWAFTRGAFPGA